MRTSADILEIKFKCHKCGEEHMIKKIDLMFGGYGGESEDYGSYGEVNVHFNCPTCKKSRSAEVYEW